MRCDRNAAAGQEIVHFVVDVLGFVGVGRGSFLALGVTERDFFSDERRGLWIQLFCEFDLKDGFVGG